MPRHFSGNNVGRSGQICPMQLCNFSNRSSEKSLIVSKLTPSGIVLMFKTAQGIRFCNYPPKFKIPKPTFDLIVFCLPGKRRLSQCTQFWFGLIMACTFNVELSLNGFYFPHVPLCPVGKPLRAFLLAPNSLQNSSHCPAIEQTHIYIKQLFMSP